MNPIQITGLIMAATEKRVEDAALSVFGCSRYTLHRVINGISKTPRIRAKISELIEKPENEIWPEEGDA